MRLLDFDKDFKGYYRFDIGAIGEFDVAVLVEQYAGGDEARELYPHWRGGYYFAGRPKGDKSAPLELTGRSLDIPKETLAGITAFYAIVNIPAHSLPAVFEQMARVLKPNGLLLLAFHVGNEVLQEHELWGYKISMDFLLFPSREVGKYLEESGFTVDEIIEREPYPEIEHQSRRAYVLARKRVE